MQLVVIGNEMQQREFNSPTGVTMHWVSDPAEAAGHANADAYFDLLFEPLASRVATLHALLPVPVVVNSVTETLAEIDPAFIRLNAWPGFLGRELAEVSCLDTKQKGRVDSLFTSLHKKTEWVPDLPGFISAKVIAMIVNEAYYALQDGVSTKEEIDTAMKLGTNYPYGPFEWSRMIGIKNIHRLLSVLAINQPRYGPAELLIKESAN